MDAIFGFDDGIFGTVYVNYARVDVMLCRVVQKSCNWGALLQCIWLALVFGIVVIYLVIMKSILVLCFASNFC